MVDWKHVFIVMRYDVPDGPISPEQIGLYVTAKVVMDSEEAAATEVKRLNDLNGGKGCVYFFQSAKTSP